MNNAIAEVGPQVRRRPGWMQTSGARLVTGQHSHDVFFRIYRDTRSNQLTQLVDPGGIAFIGDEELVRQGGASSVEF